MTNGIGEIPNFWQPGNVEDLVAKLVCQFHVVQVAMTAMADCPYQ